MSAKDQLFKNVMQSKAEVRNKVSIIGSGSVAMSIAFSILERGISNDVVIIGRDSEKVRGELLDLQHGAFFLNNANISGGTDLSLSTGSQLIIFTAGARQNEGESRFDLLQKNVEAFKVLIPRLAHRSPDAVLLVVTSPSDILSYVAWKLSGFPKNRVIGSGTHLDSTRFRYSLAQRLGAPVALTHGWIIGEHGESSIPVWSSVIIAGVPLSEIAPSAGQSNDTEKWLEVHWDAVSKRNEVTRLKGYSSSGIALSCVDIASTILSPNTDVKTVSTMVKGLCGITKEAFLSLPCMLGRSGVTSVVNIKLSDSERKNHHLSANILDEIQKSIHF